MNAMRERVAIIWGIISVIALAPIAINLVLIIWSLIAIAVRFIISLFNQPEQVIEVITRWE